MSPAPPRKGPEPQYDEKRVLSQLEEQPTGEMDLRAVARALKAQHKVFARTKRRSDLTKVGAAIAGLLGVGGGGYSTYDAHDKVAVLRSQMHDLREKAAKFDDQITEARIDLARCCPKE